jgi:hypothetical protein
MNYLGLFLSSCCELTLLFINEDKEMVLAEVCFGCDAEMEGADDARVWTSLWYLRCR